MLRGTKAYADLLFTIIFFSLQRFDGGIWGELKENNVILSEVSDVFQQVKVEFQEFERVKNMRNLHTITRFRDKKTGVMPVDKGWDNSIFKKGTNQGFSEVRRRIRWR